MWPSWLKRRARRATPCPSTELVATTATPSLKDIRSLLHPDPAAAQPPQSGVPSPRVFHRLRALQPAQVAAGEETEVAAGEEGRRLVLYYTSLQAIRRTFLDCCAVRTILQAHHAAVDERDLLMDKSFASELAALLPHRPGATMPLPQLFLGGRHVGGAQEVRRLHESGELERIVAAADASAPAPASCDRCGGKRYVLCGGCNGSPRRYSYSSGGGGHFRDCADCNKNGLVRCLRCFPPVA